MLPYDDSAHLREVMERYASHFLGVYPQPSTSQVDLLRTFYRLTAGYCSPSELAAIDRALPMQKYGISRSIIELFLGKKYVAFKDIVVFCVAAVLVTCLRPFAYMWAVGHWNKELRTRVKDALEDRVSFQPGDFKSELRQAITELMFTL